LDGLNGSPAHVAIPAVRPLAIVIVKALIEILLGFFDRAVELVAEGSPEKLI
jgi:hypothetical protein